MKILKNHIGFIAFFSFIIAVFLYPLVTMRSGFVWGDSFVQFFPWSKVYAEAIKSFSFPYWIKSMGSGFPLMAEGQVGGFYPFNILFFFILPFKVAYNYSVISHFIIGGIFTYLYARKLGADQSGGSLAALLFCFGSAYAGCFYNIVTLRTLAWFPLVLLLIEYYFDKWDSKYLFFGGIILGFQFLAGFVQMAAYSAFFYLVYFAYKAIENKISIKKALFFLLTFSIVPGIIAFPQLILTYQLAGFSGREGAAAGFALWGSVFPSGFLGIIFPYTFSFRGYLYAGTLSLLFVIFTLYSLKKDKLLRPIALVFILSIFLALGSYNPVYTFMLKLTKLYIFRNPSKFLFFGSFSLSVLAGIGLTRYFHSTDVVSRKKVTTVFFIVCSIAGFLFLMAKFSLIFFKENFIRLGDYYIRNVISNRPYQRYDLEHYNIKLFYENMLNSFSFSNIFVVLAWCIFIGMVLFCILLLRKKSRYIRYIAMSLIFIDIFIFSFYGKSFRQNIRPFAYLVPNNHKIMERLRSDPEIYRILPFDLKSVKMPNWSLPNANITYGIDSVACYTPLVSKVYRNKLSGFEAVDDSLGLKDADEAAFSTNIDILKLLNVKYVITQKELKEGSLEKVDTENGVFLYRLKGYFPRLFFSYDIGSEIRQAPAGDLKVITYKNGLIEAEIRVDREGFIIFSENYYPGWRVFVDGEEKDIIKVKDILQGVAVDKGRHKVAFIYKPRFFLFKR